MAVKRNVFIACSRSDEQDRDFCLRGVKKTVTTSASLIGRARQDNGKMQSPPPSITGVGGGPLSVVSGERAYADIYWERNPDQFENGTNDKQKK